MLFWKTLICSSFEELLFCKIVLFLEFYLGNSNITILKEYFKKITI